MERQERQKVPGSALVPSMLHCRVCQKDIIKISQFEPIEQAQFFETLCLPCATRYLMGCEQVIEVNYAEPTDFKGLIDRVA